MRRIFIQILLFSLSILPIRLAIAETYLAVDFYPVSQDAYGGDTPLNSVLRVPLSSVVSSPKCFGGLVESEKGDKSCAPEWFSFSKMCKQQIKKVVLQP